MKITQNLRLFTQKTNFKHCDRTFNKILSIYRQGYIKTKRVGDTGIGYTLETLLGIRLIVQEILIIKVLKLNHQEKEQPNLHCLVTQIGHLILTMAKIWQLQR